MISTTTVLVILLLVTLPTIRRRLFILYYLPWQPPAGSGSKWSPFGQCRGGGSAGDSNRSIAQSLAGSATSSFPRECRRFWRAVVPPASGGSLLLSFLTLLPGGRSRPWS